MFVDKETVFLKSGDGGDGAVSFMRYKGVANGGPDGGDGGRGGSIYFVADRHKSSLIDFMYKRKYVAENGGKGEPNKRHGKDGEDLYINVPLGTVVKDAESGRIICDMYKDGQRAFLYESPSCSAFFAIRRKNRKPQNSSGTQDYCRRGTYRLSQRGQVHFAFQSVGCET